jgi:hypothetical protein
MRVKKKPQSRKGLTPLMIENLIHGHNPLDGNEAFISEKHRKDTWKKHADYILSNYRDRESSQDDSTFLPLSYPSGSRPEAWWRYDNKHGMRKVISGDPKPLSPETTRGKFRLLDKFDPQLKYESQYKFLQRHNLLYPGEKEDHLRNLEVERQEILKRKSYINNSTKGE